MGENFPIYGLLLHAHDVKAKGIFNGMHPYSLAQINILISEPGNRKCQLSYLYNYHTTVHLIQISQKKKCVCVWFFVALMTVMVLCPRSQDSLLSSSMVKAVFSTTGKKGRSLRTKVRAC